MDINIVMGDDCHSAGVCGDGLWIRVYMGRSVIILIMFLKNFWFLLVFPFQFLMTTRRRVMFTSIVRESMKCPPWQRFRLSSPMNQSGEGTSFVTRETWDHFGDEILIYGNWSPTGRPLILSDCVICADYNVKTMFVTNGFTGRVEYNGGRRKTTLYNTATATPTLDCIGNSLSWTLEQSRVQPWSNLALKSWHWETSLGQTHPDTIKRGTPRKYCLTKGVD